MQFGQTRGLFLLPGGRPRPLGVGGSGAGSAGGAKSSGGGNQLEATMHAASVQELLEFD